MTLNIKPRAWSLAPLAQALALALALGGAHACHAAVDASNVLATAPTEYTVVKGDTLWDISGRFLKSPLHWPELWAGNRATVKNPHLIYPGDELVLSISNGKATLSARNQKTNLREYRLSPGMRIEDASGEPESIPSFSFAAVKNFLSRPTLIEPEAFAKTAQVIAADAGKLFSGGGGKIFSKDMAPDAVGEYSIFRQGTVLTDPDTGLVLAHEAIYLGTASVLANGPTTTLRIVNSNQEITAGDRLMPNTPLDKFTKQIRPAAADFKGKIIKIYDARSSSLMASTGINRKAFEIEGGPNSIVVVNKGSNAGLEEGNIVKVMSQGKTVGRTGTFGYISGKKVDAPIKLPDQEAAQAIVFKVFEKVSYVLILKAENPVMPGDMLLAP